jgi:hypothetical protein
VFQFLENFDYNWQNASRQNPRCSSAYFKQTHIRFSINRHKFNCPDVTQSSDVDCPNVEIFRFSFHDSAKITKINCPKAIVKGSRKQSSHCGIRNKFFMRVFRLNVPIHFFNTSFGKPVNILSVDTTNQVMTCQ